MARTGKKISAVEVTLRGLRSAPLNVKQMICFLYLLTQRYESILSMGAEAALAKVQATKTFDKCAHDAAHLQGGNAYVKGNVIESLYRHVCSLALALSMLMCLWRFLPQCTDLHFTLLFDHS